MGWLSHILRKAEEMEKEKEYSVEYEPFESMDAAVLALGADKVLQLLEDYQERMRDEAEREDPHLQESCGDPGCPTCGQSFASHNDDGSCVEDVSTDICTNLHEDPHLQEPCGDPRCATCGDFATSYRNPMPQNVHTNLHASGAVTVFAGWNERLTMQVEAESLSCTGPVVMHIRFDRELLHELHIGTEVVEIELAEVVE